MWRPHSIHVSWLIPLVATLAVACAGSGAGERYSSPQPSPQASQQVSPTGAPVKAPTASPSAAPTVSIATPPAPSPVSTSQGPQIYPTPTTASGLLTVDETMNGRSITLKRGMMLTIVLHSTYWTISTETSSNVLVLVDGPKTEPAADCVAGGGCGTVTAAYRASADGDTEVKATRTLCGEALKCSPDQALFTVSVTVTDSRL